MFASVALVATFLFTLTTSALPAAQLEPSVDKCGPTFAVATDPKDTCHSAPTILAADQAPSAFGITKVPVPVGQAVTGHWEICSGLVDELCAAMSLTGPNQWRFVSTTNAACEVGFWVPGGADDAPNPALPNGKPDTTQCKRIYTAMIEAVSQEGGMAFQGSTVNLVVAPAGQDGQGVTLPNGQGTGECFFDNCSSWWYG